MNTTFSTLFAGIGGTCLGLKNAGFLPISHFEIDPRLAAVGQANTTGLCVVGDICEANFLDYQAPHVLAASPVCKNASLANTGACESDADVATAKATCRALRAWQPKIFFLENVWGYRHFEAFQLIKDELDNLGYSYDFWHLNSADFGVPQTRKRLILVAIRERGHSGARMKIVRPTPTHAAAPELNLFGTLEKWVGWYEAIEDLITTLPESKFAPWQMKRLCALESSLLIPSSNTGQNRGQWHKTTDDPAMTVTVNMATHLPRGFIVEGSTTSDAFSMPVRSETEPMFTVRAGMHKIATRAALLNDQNSHGGTQIGIRRDDQPAWTTTTDQTGGGLPRALLIDGQQTQPQPDFPQCENASFSHCGKSGWGLPQMLESGRVVQMTTRALARFQSFPDSFQLSGHRITDCTGIGNAVPPLMAQRIMESYLEFLN